LWNGNRFPSKSSIENPGINIKPKHTFNAKGVVESISETKAMLDYVRRMTAKVQYTFIPTATTQPGGGIKTRRTDPPLQDASNKRALSFVAEKPNKNSLVVTQSSQVVPKNQEKANAAEPELNKPSSTQEAEKQSVSNSLEGIKLISAGVHQPAVSEVTTEPEFEHPDVHESTTEEPELEPEQRFSTDNLDEQQIQSQFPIPRNRCQSSEPTLAKDVNDKHMVELINVSDNVNLSTAQENRQSKEKAAVVEKEESDDEDFPNLTMSKVISLFALP